VIFSVRNAEQEPLTEEETMQFLTKAKEHGVLMGHIGEGKIRAVTHYGLNAEDLGAALTGVRRALIDMQL
jgi:threonine aldolase